MFPLKLTLASLALSLSLAQPSRASSWSNTGALNTGRENHTATLLPNGKLLLAGGANNNSGIYVCPASTEVYDPATGAWATNGSLTTPRAEHTATMLPSGKVLVAGGNYFRYGNGWTCLSSAELYDPAGGAWTTTGSLNAARYYHTATLLPSGKVLVAAGWNDANNNPTNGAELYDPANGTWTTTGALGIERYCPRQSCCPMARCSMPGAPGTPIPATAP